jgi:hypothetical protein
MGREKMNEGDYMKLATFLKTLHAANETIRVWDDTTHRLNYELEYDTTKNKHFVIKISHVRRIRYHGPKPNATLVTGTLNGVEFTDTCLNELAQRLNRITFVYGIKNIKRQIEDLGFEEHTTFEEFKKYVNARECPDDPDDAEFNDNYYIQTLIGCDYEMFNA